MTNQSEPPEEFEEQSDAAEEEYPEIQDGPPHRRYAGRVLLTAFLVVVCGLVLYACWPWLLPAFIYEGPMVELAGENEVTLAWYMTRPVDSGMMVRLEGKSPREIAVQTNGTRCRARIADLVSGQSYPYVILRGDHELLRAEFRSNKTAGQQFSFLAFGDSGRASPDQYLLAARMSNYDVDLVVHTGDLIYSRGERYRYRDRFFKPYLPLLKRVCFRPSIGNHDVTEPIDESAYFEVFDLPENGPAGITPEHEYWFDYADARFVILDTERPEPVLKENVAPWLRSVLQDAPTLWKFVVFHRPPYTAAKHAPNEAVQRTIVPVLEDMNVDLVFSGHDHLYERTYPIRGGKRAEDGPVYIITGAGGAELYQAQPPEKRPDYIAIAYDQTHSFTHVTVSGQELTLEQIALDGAQVDSWILKKAPMHSNDAPAENRP